MASDLFFRHIKTGSCVDAGHLPGPGSADTSRDPAPHRASRPASAAVKCPRRAPIRQSHAPAVDRVPPDALSLRSGADRFASPSSQAGAFVEEACRELGEQFRRTTIR